MLWVAGGWVGELTLSPRASASTGSLKMPLLEGWERRRVRRGRTVFGWVGGGVGELFGVGRWLRR